MNKATFQTRARVVELLGKEQIADAPTAISELLKNAIDAFASSATVSYSSTHNYLRIDDNGLGMRTSDILNRWLMIATESKRLPLDPSWLAHASNTQRKQARRYQPLGQKGIGRLATAALGTGILIWTRWGTGADLQTTLLLIHWGLFAHPTLRLDEIVIPYITSNDIGPEDARILADELRNWIASPEQDRKWRLESILNQSEPTSDYDSQIRRISRDLRVQRQAIIDDIDENFIPAFTDDLEFPLSQGTSLIMLSPTDQTREMFDINVNSDSDFNTTIAPLMGFSDPFGEAQPRIEVQIDIDGADISQLFGFWTPQDFSDADHEIDISVDWSGIAKGTIRRYDKSFEYEYRPTGDLPPYHRQPGPFRLHVGYVPGQGFSHIPEPEYSVINRRLEKFGALYIYRDGIRVLPYGRIDNDFLGFEERRSRNAGRNFFSHRRMFGGVYIDSVHNSELRDKAGREGFIKNGAYRGFTKFLIDIFIDLAYRYYGSNADRTEELGNIIGVVAPDVAESARMKAEAAAEEFLRTVPRWIKQLSDARKDLNREAETAQEMIAGVEKQTSPSREDLQKIDRYIERIRNDVKDSLDFLGTDPPTNTIIPESVRPNFETYLSERQQYEISANASIGELVRRYDRIAKRVLPEIVRLEGVRSRIVATQQECLTRIETAYQEFTNACSTVARDFAPKWKERQKLELYDLISSLGEDPAAAVVHDASGKSAALLEEILSKQLSRTREVYSPFWSLAISQINSLGEDEGSSQTIGSLIRALEKLEERGQILSELAQVGLIVEAVDHDYHVLFRNLGDELNELSALVKEVPNATSLIARITHSINSIDQKAQLLSPAYHKDIDVRETLTGKEIKDFVDSIFINQLDQLSIEYSELFLKTQLSNVYKPVVLAASANLVENSVYWTSRSAPPRKVKFTIVPHGFVVSDSGPGIAPRDRERVFEPFFSRRPYGRGLGLYITRTNLEAKGMQITVAPERQRGALAGVNFIITKRNGE